MNKNALITELNGEPTELTEDEIALLLAYRMADEEGQKEILELVENLNK